MFSFFNNFTSGELAQRIYPRIDLVQWKNGAKTMLNALPTVHGGFIGRPGTGFVCRAKFGNKVTRLIPFEFSVDQTYVIELGDLYMRFITQGGRLEETAKNVEAITNAGSLIQVTSTAHGYSNGNFIALRNILGTVEANGDWQIQDVTTDTFVLTGSTYINTYVSGGTARKIIEIVSPYGELDLEEVQYAPDSDLLYFVHPDYPPQVLTRTSATTFTITDLELIDGPFNDLNLDETHTMTPSATTGNITVTSNVAYFTSAMVGQLLRIGSPVSGVQGYVEITSFTSNLVVNATVRKTLSGIAATVQWALGAFGEATKYPHTVSWFDQRLVFGGTDTQPQTVWMSATTRVLDFAVGTTASDAVTFTIRTEDVNQIEGLASSTDLIVFTSAGEHKVTGGDNQAIAPSNIVVRQQTAYGSSNVRPVKIGELVAHVQRGGQRIRTVSFSFDKDRYISNDLTLLAYHLFNTSRVQDMSFQLQPDPIIWFVMSNGSLRSCTLLPEQNVAGFAQHSFLNGAVERCVSLPQALSTDDETYLLIRRTINGAQVKYIEVFNTAYTTDSTIAGVFSPAVSTVQHLTHLEGQSVKVIGDDAVYNDKPVFKGSITFESGEVGASNIEVGLGFVPTVTLLSPEWELPDGPTFGRIKHFNKVLVYTTDTVTLALNGDEAEARAPEDFMDTAIPALSTQVFQFTTLGNSTQAHLTITQPSPIPISVVGVYGECTIGA